MLRRVVVANRRARKPRLVFAIVANHSSHHHLLRYWMASAGIPDRDSALGRGAAASNGELSQGRAYRRLLRGRAVERDRRTVRDRAHRGPRRSARSPAPGRRAIWAACSTATPPISRGALTPCGSESLSTSRWGGWAVRDPLGQNRDQGLRSHAILISPSTCSNSLSPVSSSARFSLASAAAKQSA